MKRRPIAFKLLASIIAIVIVLQSVSIAAGYFIFESTNRNSFREDNASLCDMVQNSFDKDLFNHLYEMENEDFDLYYPNKLYVDLTEEERTEYTARFDDLNTFYQLSFYQSYFGLASSLSISDYLTIGFINDTHDLFVGLFVYSNKDNEEVREIGFYMDIPDSITDCIEKGESSFDGVNSSYNGIALFSSGRKFSSNQDFEVWLIFDQKMSTINKDTNRFLLYFIAATSSVTVLLLIATIFVLNKIGIKPIKKISKKSIEYTNDLKNGTLGDSFNTLSNKNDEIADLNNSFYYLDKELKDYVSQIKEATSNEEKMKSELDLAKRIQMSALPSEDILDKDIEINAWIRPAKEVGGDLYGFEKISDDKLYFYIGDVSGKGVPAALFMMQAKTLLQENLSSGDLLKAITKTNNRLARENSEFLFITAFIGMLDIRSGELEFINAAHEPVFLGRNGAYKKLDEVADVPLSTLEGYEYHLQKVKLEKGDSLFLYTDGVSEAMNKEGKLYGKKRIEETLTSLFGAENTSLLSEMSKSIDDYANGEEQSDDICMIAFSYFKGNELILRKEEDLESVLPFVTKVLSNELDKDNLSKITVTLDELLNNVLQYGRLDGKQFSLLLYFDNENKQAVGIIRDNGVPFNPLKDAKEREENQIGGFGILLSKSLVDSLSYSRIGNSNVTKFTKKNN